MLEIAGDEDLTNKVRDAGKQIDRTWANAYAMSFRVEEFKQRVRLPTREELENDDELRRKAAAIVSYVMAEGSVWMMKDKWEEYAANITFADHEMDLYEHFRTLCREVFLYDIGPAQDPGNGAAAIRGFIYSRYVAEWLIANGVKPGEKSAFEIHLPRWVMGSRDSKTWISALQPWCDGEGSVLGSNERGRPSFSLVQSRHTDLDAKALPASLASDGDRVVTKGVLAKLIPLGIDVLSHCNASNRSEVLEDVRGLFVRLGMNPILGVNHLYLKDDGFWSCIWELRFGVEQTEKLLSLGLIIGERKKKKAMRARAYNSTNFI
jgi:hypothetical protein